MEFLSLLNAIFTNSKHISVRSADSKWSIQYRCSESQRHFKKLPFAIATRLRNSSNKKQSNVHSDHSFFRLWSINGSLDQNTFFLSVSFCNFLVRCFVSWKTTVWLFGCYSDDEEWREYRTVDAVVFLVAPNFHFWWSLYLSCFRTYFNQFFLLIQFSC